MKKEIKFLVKYICALASSLYLFSLGVFVRKHRELIVKIFSHFFYVPKEITLPKLPVIEQAKVLNDAAVTTIWEAAFVSGNVDVAELVILSNLVKSSKPERIFEFGTFDGRTTLNLAGNSDPDAVVYTLDLPREKLNSTALAIALDDKLFIDKPDSGVRYKRNPLSKKIIQLFGDSAEFDFTPYLNTIDFIFIDASHSYDYVHNDTQIAMKLLRNKRGIILWHDYARVEEWEGLTRALNEFYASDPTFKNLRHIRGTSLAYLSIA